MLDTERQRVKDLEAKQKRYAAALLDSAKALWSATGKHRISGFGYPAGDKGHFDTRYWRILRFRRPDPALREEALLLKGGDAAKAISAIVERPDLWTMDCAMFVQVVQLSALLKALGNTDFNRFMNEQKKLTQEMIILQNHYSTGLIPHRAFSTDESGRPVQISPGSTTSPDTLPREQRASEAPIGSEVVFYNPDAPDTVDDAYIFENAIKIGPDKYIAYPFGDPQITGKNLRKQMQSMTSATTTGGPSAKRRRKSKIEISSVAEFEFFR